MGLPGDLDARPGLRPPRDPRRNEWSLVDLGVGWLAGAATMTVVALIVGAVAGLSDGGTDWIGGAAIAVLFGLPVLGCYGIPIAAVAASLLRPVRAEWIHLAVFAGLGAIGCALFSLVMSEGGIGLIPATLPYGVPSAVVARLVAKRIAIRGHDARTRGASRMPDRAEPADPGGPASV
ncbi:hypothetical protein GCM10009846_12140 [Agrococcus versicolor]|uniref:Uncharacterized protein n=1 Tax=Agrococcus versicolor TaxID=501482 RepID=A0ABP5MDV3_9MICO